MPTNPAQFAHAHLLARAPRILRYDPQDYFPEWQSAVRRSFKQLLGLMPAKIDLQIEILSESPRDIRFAFSSEPAARIEARIQLPATKEKPPILIHLGNEPYALPPEEPVALIHLPLRGTDTDALTALMLGRTLIGERVLDTVRLIDALTEHFSDRLDTTRIAIAGNLEAFYAAAFEPRIAAALIDRIQFFQQDLPAPSVQQLLPNTLHYFERSDLAALLFPRPLLIAEANACTAEMQTIYASQNAPDKCVSAKTPPLQQWHTLTRLLNWNT